MQQAREAQLIADFRKASAKQQDMIERLTKQCARSQSEHSQESTSQIIVTYPSRN